MQKEPNYTFLQIPNTVSNCIRAKTELSIGTQIVQYLCYLLTSQVGLGFFLHTSFYQEKKPGPCDKFSEPIPKSAKFETNPRK